MSTFDWSASSSPPYTTPINIPNVTVPISIWKKVWDDLPVIGDIVPVWDGQFLYYATYWHKEGSQFWVIADQMGLHLEDIAHRKKAGEQVFPTHWMKIESPVS